MKVKSIKIENYKSFAEIDNIIKLDTINTIIGKNEAGKSNLIEGIGKIELTGINDSQYFRDINKNNTEKQPSITLVLIPYANEKNIYESREETTLIVSGQFNIEIKGGLTDTITNNKEFQNNRARMNDLNKNIVLNDETKRKQFKNIVNMINDAESKIFIKYKYLDNIMLFLEGNSKYEDFVKYLKLCIEYLTNIHSIFPKFILLDDVKLESKYTKKFLEDNKESKKMLEYLLKAIGMSLKDITNYWKLTKDDDKCNLEEEINTKIQIFINQFNKFYKQEKIALKIKFDKDEIKLFVKTTNKYLNLSERSNGLKWYLNMYIQLFAKTTNADMRNYVILLDEPGVYLHVNAQKEILRLFEEFTKNNNQILYTTQLPTMIYQNHLYRIRTIMKDEFGNSHIGNSYHSLPHDMKSKMETITPVLTAIGMNMGYSFSAMSFDKINIIVEGISDYNYIKAFLLQKKYKKEVNIIPSSGVANIHNIVSILIGWGYNYKILIDQDKAGRKQYNVLIEKLLVNQDDIKFIDGTNKKNNSANSSIENIFSIQDQIKIGIDGEDYDKEKAYYSLETLKKVENKEYGYDNETMRNFERIFDGWLNYSEL